MRKTSRVVKILALVIVLLIMCSSIAPLCTSCDTYNNVDSFIEETENNQESTVVEPTETDTTEMAWELVTLPVELDYPEQQSLHTINDVMVAIELCKEFIIECNNVELVPATEHPQTGDLIELTETAQSNLVKYEQLLSAHWNARKQARPVMTEIWQYLTTVGGLSPEVTAGIIGNMCAESGGNGYHDIDVHNWDNSTGKSYYGICQWSVKYNPQLANTDLDFQLEHLLKSLNYNFDNWGRNYSSRYGAKFGTEQFLAMTDPYEAAIAFAMCYERCSSKHVEHRGPLADKAYEYFTLLNSWPWPGSNPIA